MPHANKSTFVIVAEVSDAFLLSPATPSLLPRPAAAPRRSVPYPPFVDSACGPFILFVPLAPPLRRCCCHWFVLDSTIPLHPTSCRSAVLKLAAVHASPLHPTVLRPTPPVRSSVPTRSRRVASVSPAGMCGSRSNSHLTGV